MKIKLICNESCNDYAFGIAGGLELFHYLVLDKTLLPKTKGQSYFLNWGCKTNRIVRLNLSKTDNINLKSHFYNPPQVESVTEKITFWSVSQIFLAQYEKLNV